MKKLIIAMLAIVAVVLASCHKNKDHSPSNNKVFNAAGFRLLGADGVLLISFRPLLVFSTNR